MWDGHSIYHKKAVSEWSRAILDAGKSPSHDDNKFLDQKKLKI